MEDRPRETCYGIYAGTCRGRYIHIISGFDKSYILVLATHPFLKKSAPAELLNALEQKEAYGRGAEVWEVANVMMFLASDYSSYMTGETVSCSSQRG